MRWTPCASRVGRTVAIRMNKFYYGTLMFNVRVYVYFTL